MAKTKDLQKMKTSIDTRRVDLIKYYNLLKSLKLLFHHLVGAKLTIKTMKHLYMEIYS